MLTMFIILRQFNKCVNAMCKCKRSICTVQRILMCVNAAFSIYMNEEQIERHKSILHFLKCIIVFKAIAFLHS